MLKSRDRETLYTYNTYQLDNFVQLFTNRDRIIPFSFLLKHLHQNRKPFKQWNYRENINIKTKINKFGFELIYKRKNLDYL